MTEQIQLSPSQRYYIANKAIEKEKKRAYRKAKKEKVSAWYEANKATILELKREYDAANIGHRLEAGRAWRKANPEKIQNGKAKYNSNIIGELTPGLIPKLLESQKWTCIVCDKDLRLGYHVDHTVPVSKGGQNVDSNIQILCPKCNLSKGNKDFAEFLKGRGLDPSNYSGLSNPSESLALEEA